MRKLDILHESLICVEKQFIIFVIMLGGHLEFGPLVAKFREFWFDHGAICCKKDILRINKFLIHLNPKLNSKLKV